MLILKRILIYLFVNIVVYDFYGHQTILKTFWDKQISKTLVNMVNHPDFKKMGHISEIKRDRAKWTKISTTPRSIHNWNLVAPQTLGNFFKPRSTL